MPDLAVGRLVKTPDGDRGHDRALPELGPTTAPCRSPTTGGPVAGDGLRLPGGRRQAGQRGVRDGAARRRATTTLIERGRHAARRLLERRPTCGTSCSADHHDLVYLAGHFSANDTLAADFDQTTPSRPPSWRSPANAGKLPTPWCSARAATPATTSSTPRPSRRTDTEDWSQRLAQQQALLIGGTGYQYGDTDFLEYSERLYLGSPSGCARARPTGPTADPVAIGEALALAKQDYLASLSTLQGIDQKAVLQATLYGLPMTGFDAPGREPIGGDGRPASRRPPSRRAPARRWPARRRPRRRRAERRSTSPTSTPRSTSTTTSGHSPQQVSPRPRTQGVPAGADLARGPRRRDRRARHARRCPSRSSTSPRTGSVLRGVGFRSGYYRDTTGPAAR